MSTNIVNVKGLPTDNINLRKIIDNAIRWTEHKRHLQLAARIDVVDYSPSFLNITAEYVVYLYWNRRICFTFLLNLNFSIFLQTPSRLTGIPLKIGLCLHSFIYSSISLLIYILHSCMLVFSQFCGCHLFSNCQVLTNG